MAESHLPFKFSASDFRSDFLRQYMLPLAQWISGAKDVPVRAQLSGSPWESAISINYCIEILEIASADAPDWHARNHQQIKSKIIDVAKWLLETAQPSRLKSRVQDSSLHEVHWENVTWDTATITRILFITSRRFPNELGRETLANIDTAIAGSLTWLLRKFKEWNQSGKYSFGSADIAAVGGCLIELLKSDDGYVESLKRRGLIDLNELDIEQALYDLVELLLYDATKPSKESIPEGAENDLVADGYWWDDYFTTADVVVMLGNYLNLITKGGRDIRHLNLATGDVQNKQNTDDIREELLFLLRSKICHALNYFGISQSSGGMWGSHIDTIKALNAYVWGGEFFPERGRLPGKRTTEISFSPEVHITFKALRWICDEKQFFSDKSFLHTMFLSSFCAETFVTVYRYWDDMRCSTPQLLDDVIWAAPARSDAERAERAKVELAFERYKRQNEDRIATLADENAKGTELYRGYLNANRRIVAGLLIFFLVVITLIFQGILDVKLDLGNNPMIFFGIVGFGSVLFTIVVFVIGAITPRR